MIVFINDHPIRLVSAKVAAKLTEPELVRDSVFTDYDLLVDARLEVLKAESLQGHLLILNSTPATVSRLLTLLQKADTSQLLSITLGCQNKEACEEAIKKTIQGHKSCRRSCDKRQ